MSEFQPIERVFESRLDGPADAIWQSVTSFDGINAELMPFASMRCTDGTVALQQAPGDAPPFELEVTMRLFGLLPIQTAPLRIIEWGEKRFVEQSKQPGMASWQHERVVEPAKGGSRVVDRLTFRPAFLPGVAATAIDILFRHRHRQLVRRWNTAGAH